MNKYRLRRAPWVPTPAQVTELRTMLSEFSTLFARALVGINEAGT